MPKVSVIIPCFNAEEFIKAAIESVLAQSHQDFELLVINNNSTDSSKAIIESFSDTRIKYLEEETQGEAAARNKGIEQAQGEFLAFLDADDLWTKDKLQIHLDFHKNNPDCDLSYSNCDFLLRNSEQHTMLRLGFSGTVFYNLLVENFIITPSSVVLKKKILSEVGLFNNQYINGTDYDLWLRLAKEHVFGFIEQPLCLYRDHDKQISQITDSELILENNKSIIKNNLESHFNYFNKIKISKLKQKKLSLKYKYLFFIRKILHAKILKAIKENDYTKFVKLIKGNLCFYYAGIEIDAKKYQASIKYLLEAFKHNPEIALDLFWIKRFIQSNFKQRRSKA